MEFERELGKCSVINDYSRMIELLYTGLDEKFISQDFAKAQQAKITLQEALKYFNGNIGQFAKQNNKEEEVCLAEFNKSGDLSQAAVKLLKSFPIEVVQVMNRGLNIQNKRKIQSILKNFGNNAPENTQALTLLSSNKCIELIGLMNRFSHGLLGYEVKSYTPTSNDKANEVLNAMAEFTKEKTIPLIKNWGIHNDLDRDYMKELEKCGFKLDGPEKKWLLDHPELIRVIHGQYMLENKQINYLVNIRLSHLNKEEYIRLLLTLSEKNLSEGKLIKKEQTILDAAAEYCDNIRGTELKAKENIGQILTQEAKRELDLYEQKSIALKLNYNYCKDKKREYRQSLVAWMEKFERSVEKAEQVIQDLIDKYKNKTITEQEKIELSTAMEIREVLPEVYRIFPQKNPKLINQSAILLAKYYLNIINHNEEKDLLNVIKGYLSYDKIEFCADKKKEQDKIDNLVAKFVKYNINPKAEFKLWTKIKKFLPYATSKESDSSNC